MVLCCRKDHDVLLPKHRPRLPRLNFPTSGELFTEHLDPFQDVKRALFNLMRGSLTPRRRSSLPSVDDARYFRSGRELAAWIGLVPRQSTTGCKPRLGGIGRRTNHYLRRQMIHGARAVISRLAKREDRRSVWLKALVERRGHWSRLPTRPPVRRNEKLPPERNEELTPRF